MDWRAALDSVGNVHSTGSLTKLNSTNSAISVNQDFFYSSLQSLCHVCLHWLRHFDWVLHPLFYSSLFPSLFVMLHDLLCRSTYPHVSFLGRALLPVLHLRSCNVARFDLAGYSPPLLQPLFISTALALAPSRNLRSLQF
eukprot:g18270.t1